MAPVSFPIAFRGPHRAINRNASLPAPGFTLIELLVVISIIALLVAILLPSLSASRARARLIRCSANQKQLVLGMAIYVNDFRGRAPWDTSVLVGTHVTAAQWSGPSGRTGPTRYMTMAGILAPVSAMDNSRSTFRTCPELVPAQPLGGAQASPDEYSHYQYNYQVIGYFRSFSSGNMAWATPGFASGVGPKRFYDFVRPSSVAATSDAMHLLTDNVVQFRGTQEYYTPVGYGNRFRLGAAANTNSSSFAISTVTGYRHGEQVNFSFVDGHVEARSVITPGYSANFGALADGQ